MSTLQVIGGDCGQVIYFSNLQYIYTNHQWANNVFI